MLLAVAFATVPTWHQPAVADHGELPPGGSFVDDDGLVHEPSIEAIAHEGITYGCDEDRYCPTRAITRGEMAALIARALSLPAPTTDHFDDDDGHLFEVPINQIADAGITKGCGDPTRFCADDRLTRGQLAAFIRRAEGWEVPPGDSFVDDDSSPFEGDIEALAANGVTKGCNPPVNDRFCPDDTATRAQMATFLTRLFGFETIDPPPRPEPDYSTMSVDDSLRVWFGDRYDKARSVVRCESRFDVNAVSPDGRFHGLFQVAVRWHRENFQRVTGVEWSEGIYTAYYNSQYARYLYDQRGNWSDWPHCGA